MEKIYTVFQESELFRDLPKTVLAPLAESSHLHQFQQGDFLFYQDDRAHHFFLVQTGHFRLIQHSMIGKDVTLAMFKPGDVIGLVVSLTDDPYPGSAEALDESSTYALSGKIMWDIMQSHAGLAVRVTRLVAHRLHIAHQRIRELSVERVQQRIARSILRLVQTVGVKEANGAIRLDVRLSRQDLAQMNGTTLETVSRTLTAWERDGLVEAGREQLIILKPHSLVIVAEDLPDSI